MSCVLVVLIEHGFHNRPESFLPLEHGFLRHNIRHYIAFEASTEEVVGQVSHIVLQTQKNKKTEEQKLKNSMS